jgi:hypothetical protein
LVSDGLPKRNAWLFVLQTQQQVQVQVQCGGDHKHASRQWTTTSRGQKKQRRHQDHHTHLSSPLLPEWRASSGSTHGEARDADRMPSHGSDPVPSAPVGWVTAWGRGAGDDADDDGADVDGTRAASDAAAAAPAVDAFGCVPVEACRTMGGTDNAAPATALGRSLRVVWISGLKSVAPNALHPRNKKKQSAQTIAKHRRFTLHRTCSRRGGWATN